MKLFEKGTLASERVNGGRQLELDIIKAVAVAAMIFCHAFDECLNYGDSGGAYVLSCILAQILGASTFMICMGMSFNYTRHASVGSFLLRGFGLLSFGQLLNIFRYVIPGMICFGATGNPYFLAQSALVFSVDILQMAGLSFLLLALFKAIKASPRTVFLCSIVLSAIGYFLLSWRQTGRYFLDQLLGFFYATETESYFPLFTWFIFPAFGYYFGEIYTRTADKRKLYRPIFVLGIPFCVIWYALRFGPDPLGLGDLTELTAFTNMHPVDALASIVLNLVVIGIAYGLSRLLEGKKLRILPFVSKHINKYYCISYVLIMSLSFALLAITGDVINRFWIAFLAAIGIFGLTTLSVLFYEKYMRERIDRQSLRTKLAIFAAVWVISLAFSAYAFPRVTEYSNYLNDYLDSSETVYFE